MYLNGSRGPIPTQSQERFIGPGFIGFSPLAAGLIGAGIGYLGGELLHHGPGYYGYGYPPGYSGYGPGYGPYYPGGPGYGYPGYYGGYPGYGKGYY